MGQQGFDRLKAPGLYTELMRLVSVGAYVELQHDGSYPPDDGSVESTVLESIDNLEALALINGLRFVWDERSKTYTLESMVQHTLEPKRTKLPY